MKKKKYKSKKAQIRLAVLFLCPWVVGMVLFSLYPICSAIYYSFTEYNLMKAPKFVGLENYVEIFHDKNFFKSVYNSLYFVVIGVTLQLALSIFSAILLNSKIRGRGIFRTLYYLPSIVSPVANAIIWMWMLNPQYGLVNAFLKFFHLPQPLWLSSATWSKPAAILMALWAVGNTIIVYLAGIGDISKDYYEAIDLDGGGPWAKFRYITWPMLSNVTFFQLINGIIAGFATFTQSYMVAAIEPKGNGTLGGVKNSLLFYAVNIYNESFRYLKFGYASAMAVIMLIGMIVITLILFKTSKKWVYYGGGGRDNE